jgi:hypothetical protein
MGKKSILTLSLTLIILCLGVELLATSVSECHKQCNRDHPTAYTSTSKKTASEEVSALLRCFDECDANSSSY